MPDYFVKNGGNDLDTGLSYDHAWATLAKTNGVTFNAGDHIILDGLGIWYENLTATKGSGTQANPIVYDSYGNGVPTISGKKLLQSSDWADDGGNIWKTTIAAADRVFFDGVWGDRKTGAKTDCVNKYDYYFTGTTLYVYSESNPATWYGVPIEALCSSQLLNCTKNYHVIQNLALWGTYGDLVRFYNCIAPKIRYCELDAAYWRNGLTVRGIYLDTVTDGEIDSCTIIHASNGVQVNNGSGNKLRNSIVAGHINWALYDNGNHITYSNNHFYGNYIRDDILSQLVSRISGGTDGGGNISHETAINLKTPGKWPSRLSVRIDDAGGVEAVETLLDSIVPAYTAAGLKIMIGVEAGREGYTAGLITKLNTWFGQGHVIASHGWSHQSYQSLNGMIIQYVGVGTACEMTIAGNILTTTVTGGPGGEDLAIDLTAIAYDEMSELVAYINGLAAYTCTIAGTCNAYVHTKTLADVAGQDIKTATYTASLSKERLVKDELATSKSRLDADITGLSVKHYIWPYNLHDSDTRQWCEEAGYEAGWANMPTDGWQLETGIPVFGLWCPSGILLHGQTETEIKNRIRMLDFAAKMWGCFGVIYSHAELTAAEHGYLIDVLTELGSYKTAQEMIDIIKIGVNPAVRIWGKGAEQERNLTPGDTSPCRNAGADLGLTEDIIGTPVPQETNPSIGAYEWFLQTILKMVDETLNVIESAIKKLRIRKIVSEPLYIIDGAINKRNFIKITQETLRIVETASHYILRAAQTFKIHIKNISFAAATKGANFIATARMLIFEAEDKEE